MTTKNKGTKKEMVNKQQNRARAESGGKGRERLYASMQAASPARGVRAAGVLGASFIGLRRGFPVLAYCDGRSC